MDKVFRGQAKYIRIAPRKVRLLATLLKGMSAGDAQAQLMHAPARSAPVLLKLVRSVMSNAKLQGADPDKLVIKNILVDQGPMMKRFLPRARGMATPLQKKMSHISIEMAESEKASSRFTIVIKKKAKKEAAPKEVARRKASRKEEGKEKEKEKGGEQDKSGLIKRVFRRKSTTGK